MDVGQWDTDNDGLVVIDIDMDGNDFKMTNTNWIIESAGRRTFAVFRILGGSNMVLNQATILAGDGILDNASGSGSNPPYGPVAELRAMFVYAKHYKTVVVGVPLTDVHLQDVHCGGRV